MLHSIPLGILSFSSGGYAVDNSAMFNDGSTQYLLRTPNTARSTNGDKINTVSFWFKRGILGTTFRILNGRNSGGTGAYQLGISSSDQFNFHPSISGSEMNSTMVFRDPHAWYHVVCSLDTTQSTEADRYGFWVNGVDMRDNLSGSKPAQNLTVKLNENGVNQVIAAYQDSSFMNYWDGYLAEFVVIDGQKLDADQFGEFDNNGVWRPIDVSELTFGNNGYYLPFTTSAGLGQDYSGSSNEQKVQENTYNAGSEVNNGDMSGSAAGIAYTAIATAKLATVKINSSSRGFTNVTVQVQTDNGSNAPDGTTLTNGEATGITGSGTGLKTVDFPNGGPELTAGTKYWIVIPSTDLGSGFEWGIQHDVSGSGGALGIIDGTGYQAGRGFGHEAYQVGNHFKAVNSPTQTTDTCTDNHATWSPIVSYNKGVAFSEGNSRSTTSTTAGDVGGLISGFELPTSGKYYWEWVTNTVGTTPLLGWRDITTWSPNSYTSSENNAAKFITGTDYNTGSGRILSSTIDGSTSLSQAAYGNFLTVSGNNPLQNGTVLGCAYDADNGLAWFSYNNTWVDGNGTDSSSTVKGEIEAGTSGSQAFTTANGAVGEAGLFITASVQSISSGDFTLRTRSDQWTGTCPTGFTALSTKNQAEAVTYAIKDGSAYHQTSIWQGNTTARKITQDGNSTFKPDFLWGKNRDNSGYSFRLFDAVRGDSKLLQLGGTSGLDAESTDTNGQTDFEVDGFDIGNGVHLNDSGDNIVGWQWLAGNGTSTPSGGSVSSTVSVNQAAGFSIVSWTGTGANATVAHGLGATPQVVIVKNRSVSSGWYVGHASAGFNYELRLDEDGVRAGSATLFNETNPTSTVFTVGSAAGTNGNTNNMIAYCWAEKPGFSKFGSYVGNGNANGPVIETGFSPSWIMFKRITGSVASWAIYDNARDPHNAATKMLLPDSSAGDNVGNEMDWLSNGVKIKGTSGAYNGSSNTYIYMAYAEHPFAGPTPATAR